MLKMDSQKRPISHIPKEKNYVFSNQLNIPTHQNVQEESMKGRYLPPVLEREKNEEFGNNLSKEPVQADSGVGRDISLINENNNENAKTLTQDLKNSTQKHSVNTSSSNNTVKDDPQLHDAELVSHNPIQPKSVFSPENLEPCKASTSDSNDHEKSTKEDSKDKQEEKLENDYDMVIERDGHFDLVTPDDMNALVSRMKRLPANSPRKQKSTKNQRHQLEPQIQRPLTANSNNRFQRNNLENRPFSTCSSYNSPYALTAEQKEAVQKQLRITKEKMRKAMKEEKEKEEEKRKINKMAFECWLNQTKEKEMAVRKQSKLQEEMEKNKREEEERIRKETDIHRIWVQKKHKQLKQEQLLRKRQQQEMDSVKKYRSPEEIENAYQKWLESKYTEKKKQKYIKKQKNWFHQRLLHRSRLIKNMTWNLCLNNSFRYKDPRNAALKLK